MKHLLIFVLGVIFNNTQAQSLLLPEDTHDKMYYGWSIDSDDDRLIVGSYGETIDDEFNYYGAIYIYKIEQTGVILEKRQQTPITGNMWFGYSTAISGSNAFVGYGSNSCGMCKSAFVFELNDAGNWWAPQHIVKNENFFGNSIAMSNNTSVISAMGNGPGAVSIFELENDEYIFKNIIKPSDETFPQTYFGEALDIYENKVIVGAYGAKNYQGAVYIIKKVNNLWEENQKIPSPSNSVFSHFGDDVAIYENRIAVGCPRDSVGFSNSGSVYIYEQVTDSFELITRIIPPNNEENAQFGYSVDMHDNYLLVGSPRKDVNEKDEGAAYLYYKNESDWVLLREITVESSGSDSKFGTSVSLNGTHLFIGGYGYLNEDGFCSGAVYYEPLE